MRKTIAVAVLLSGLVVAQASAGSLVEILDWAGYSLDGSVVEILD